MVLGKKNGGMLWFLLNLAFGLYFLNKGLKFVDLSTIITSSIDNIFTIIGGALIVIGGVMHIMKRPATVLSR